MANYAHQQKMGDLHGWSVYLLEEEGGDYCKVGSAFNVMYRLQGLRGGNARPLSLIQSWHFVSREKARAVEKMVLKEADEYGIRVPGRDWIYGPTPAALSLIFRAIDAIGGLK